MEFDLRDSLLILGPLFVIAILLHGYWRMRVNSNELKMSLDKSFLSGSGDRMSDEEDIDMLRAELPNGGARVRKIPEQTAIDLNESDNVPVLMEPVESPEQQSESSVDDQGSSSAQVSDDERVEPPEHYIVIYVTAGQQPFAGQALLECLVERDLQFGEMDIFHRHDEQGGTLFSLVNAVEPGTFDMSTIGEISTPAVSLFMRTHEQADPLAAYDAMMEVAQSIADELGGDVKDESRSIVTPQTMEHCRESLRDYRRKHL